jgi:hypothetical protein
VCLPYNGAWPELMCQCQSMIDVTELVPKKRGIPKTEKYLISMTEHRWPHGSEKYCSDAANLKDEAMLYATRLYPCCRLTPTPTPSPSLGYE